MAKKPKGTESTKRPVATPASRSFATKRATRSASRRIPPFAWVIAAAVVLVVALIAANSLGIGRTNREGIASTNAKSLGPSDAPVVVTEFSSFQ